MPDDDAPPGGDATSPWSPGADVEFVHPPALEFRRDDTLGAGSSQVGERRGEWATGVDDGRVGEPRRRRRAAVASAVGIAVIATGFAIGPDLVGGPTGDATEIAARGLAVGTRTAPSIFDSDLGGDVSLESGEALGTVAPSCAAARLPSSIVPLWERAVAGLSGGGDSAAVGDQAVVVVAALDDSDASTGRAAAVVALDAITGEERWRTALQPATGSHEVVGIVDGAVVVRSIAGPDVAYRRLFAFDEATGDVLWDRGFRGEWSAAVNSEAGVVVVRVRRPSASDGAESEVELVDPRTGRRRHVAAGELIAVDAAGLAVTRVGDSVLASSRAERTPIGVVSPSDSAYAIVGDELVVASRESTAGAVVERGDAQRTIPFEGTSRIDPPGFVLHLDTLGDSSLLVVGDRAVHGASVEDDAVQLRWRAVGAMLGSAPTDRGRAVLLALRGGAEQRVVDGSTGRTIAELELREGALSSLGFFANGIVVQQTVDGQPQRQALDLDGRELWSIPGAGPLAGNAGLIVDVEAAASTDPDGSADVIRAYSGEAGTVGCAG